MGMLTAEFPPSAGDATLAGYSVTNEPEQTRRRIGTCARDEIGMHYDLICFSHLLLFQATVLSLMLISRT
jgi:ABC-type multidrug transport system ATPase subunit